MAIQTPDDLENDDEMREKLEAAIKGAHPEEYPKDDPFATDALGNPPASNIPGGEENSSTDSESSTGAEE